MLAITLLVRHLAATVPSERDPLVAMEQVGFDVVTLGDVSGDGRDDLVLSGANDDRVYVIAGVVEEPGESSSGGRLDRRRFQRQRQHEHERARRDDG